MNRFDAAPYFLKGDLIGFFKAKPLGLVTSAIFIECLNHASGVELDNMIANCLSLGRNYYMGHMELDADYRCRGISHAKFLDEAESDFRGFSTVSNANTIKSKFCYHDWKSYHGLLESYEYCSICNERRG